MTYEATITINGNDIEVEFEVDGTPYHAVTYYEPEYGGVESIHTITDEDGTIYDDVIQSLPRDQSTAIYDLMIENAEQQAGDF